MSTGTQRCWGNGKATPYEIAPPANVVTLGAYHAMDKEGALWERDRDTWSKTAYEHVKLFATRDGGHIVTVHDDGLVRVKRGSGWLSSGETIVIAGAKDVKQVVATWPTEWVNVSGDKPTADRGCILDNTGAVRCWSWDAVLFDTALEGTMLVNARLVCALDDKREVRCALPTPGYMKHPALVSALSGAKTIAGGSYKEGGRVCGVFDDGSLTCVDIETARFGDPLIKPANKIAVPPVEAVVLDDDVVYALLRTGGVMAWGLNDATQLGDGTWIDRAQPVAVSNLLEDPLPPPSDGAGKEQDDPTEMDWSTLPEKCTHADEVSVGDIPVRIVSAYGWRRADNDFELRFASYRQRPLPGTIVTLRGAQKMLRLTLRAERKISAGVYKAGTKRELYVRLERRVERDVKRTTDTFKVTTLTKDWICGTLLLDGKEPGYAIAARFLDF
jgi:hypothetical protein